MGGAERVAANICVYAPEGEFEFHYLVFEGHDNVYGHEIEARGGTVITMPPPSAGYMDYLRRLKRLILENHYDAVHSHTMFNSGLNLLVAKFMGVPVRISHSHTTKTERRTSYAQRMYEWVMRRLILSTATDLIACGVEAGEWLYGTRAFSKRGYVIRNGIDTQAFSYSEENRKKVRALYGLSDVDFVIGHSGSLIPLKNQEFLIRLLPKVLKLRPNAKLMLLGTGAESEKNRLLSIAEELGVSDCVTFCGGVMNANECLSAMDVFAFPSLREGTPLALIEAQANGLPCIVSDRIPDDAVLTDLVQSVSLENEQSWVNSLVLADRTNPKKYGHQIEALGYSVRKSYLPLYQIYQGENRPSDI